MIGPNQYRTWMEINLDAIVHNFLEAKKHMPPGCAPMAIVKSNSYGLGAAPIAQALEKAGCSYFGVTLLEEAAELRDHGIGSRILALAPVPDALAAQAIELNVESPVFGYEQAHRLSDLALSLGKKMTVQIKLDVGMNRIGIPLSGRFEAAKHETEAILHLPGLHVTGVFCHITCSDAIGGDALNRSQLELFDQMVRAVEADGFHLEKHCLSSKPFLRYPAYSYDYVRLGALLYGCMSDAGAPFTLQPAVGMYARILQLKTVEAGQPVSYGPLFHTLRQTRIATVGVGFSDGIRRSIIHGGGVLLHGKRAPYIGMLCSDYAMVDVTDIPDVHEGDIAVIFGKSGALTQSVADYAAIYPASVSETTASITSRIPRFYTGG